MSPIYGRTSPIEDYIINIIISKLIVFHYTQTRRHPRIKVYHTYARDGGSSSYSCVKSEQPYGPDVDIVKEECIGHMQKHMGTRLGIKVYHIRKGWRFIIIFVSNLSDQMSQVLILSKRNV